MQYSCEHKNMHLTQRRLTWQPTCRSRHWRQTNGHRPCDLSTQTHAVRPGSCHSCRSKLPTP